MGLPNLLYLLWDPSEKGEIKDLLLPMASKTPLNGLISCFFSPPWHLEISSQVSSLTTGLLEFHKSLPDHNHQTLQTLTCHFQPYLLSSEPDSCFWEAPNQPDVGLNCLWKDLETASSIHFFCVLKLTFFVSDANKENCLSSVKSEDLISVLEWWGLEDRKRDTREGQKIRDGKRMLAVTLQKGRQLRNNMRNIQKNMSLLTAN